MKEEEEDERLEMMSEAFGLEGMMKVNEDGSITASTSSPIHSEEAVDARNDFVREGYQKSMTSNSKSNNVTASQQRYESTTAQHERQQIHRPNLDIPVDGGVDYITRAQ